MKYSSILTSASIALALALPSHSFAADDSDEAYAKRVALSKKIKQMREIRSEMPVPPPSGLFGVYHLPEKGQFVTGINVQNHKFSGLIKGTDSVSPQSVVASSPNRFFGAPGQPPTLRIMPKSAEANIIFPFMNYTVHEKFSLVALAPLISKKTVLETFNGPGTASLGTTTVRSQGLGDIKFGFLYTPLSVHNDKGERTHNVILDVVLSAPTGNITQEDTILTPANTKMKTRLPYGMQLGSGTWDTLLGVAYWGKNDKLGWGAQYLATIPLQSENSEGWSYGDKHEGTGWISYSFTPAFVSSLRLRHEYQDTIQGIDPKIFGPGLGANPDNYGGTKTEFMIGGNWMYNPGRNLSVELSKPIAQDRNGVQAEQDYSIMVSWRNVIF